MAGVRRHRKGGLLGGDDEPRDRGRRLLLHRWDGVGGSSDTANASLRVSVARAAKAARSPSVIMEPLSSRTE